MRSLVFAALLSLPGAALAQNRVLTGDDSALVGRILLAEDHRDATSRALSEGVRHADRRISRLALRAMARIGDSTFARRDSLLLPPLAAPPLWPEPAWRLRYRALGLEPPDCGALRGALADSAWPVRLRAVDLAASRCPPDDSLASILRAWVDGLPRDASRRAPGGISWHAAAHALVALARMRAADVRPRIVRLAAHGDWHVRLYAARAAAAVADTATVRALARDPDDNVMEAAIDALSRLTGHTDDTVYIAALGAEGAQAVRAAARALRGSPRAAAAANAAFARWAARGNESERDARLALLAAAGRPPSDDRPPRFEATLPPRAVALALGEEVRLRVTMAASSGGGTFVVRLRGDVAPIMAARILALANAHYYDGLDWHRVEHDFVIQGGSPGSNEFVGYSRYLRDELGTVPHVRGTVGMSTRGHDTGDAQWFVNLRDNRRLDRDYTVFGEVIEGLDVVDGVLEGDVIASIVEIGRPRLTR